MNRRNLIAGIAALPLLALPSGEQASAAWDKEEYFALLIDVALDATHQEMIQVLWNTPVQEIQEGSVDFEFHVLVNERHWPWPDLPYAVRDKETAWGQHLVYFRPSDALARNEPFYVQIMMVMSRSRLIADRGLLPYGA